MPVQQRIRTRKDLPAETFEELIKRAVAAGRAVQEADRLEAFKLSAEAFLRSSMEIGHTSLERLAQLRGTLDSGKPGLEPVQKSLRQMIALVRSRNMPAPPRELRRLSFMMSPESMAALASLGSSTFELFALAVQIAGERFPDAFGTSVSYEATSQRLIDLTLQRDALYEDVNNAWRFEDTDEFNVDLERGTARMCFKISRGAVAVHPKADAGKRLVEWLMVHSE